MFKQVMKYTLLAVIWKRYRVLILATVGLFVYFWLVGLIHQDYLAVMERKGDSGDVGLSFTLKWVALLVGQGVYLVFLALWKRSPKADRKSAVQVKQNHKTEAARKSEVADEDLPAFNALRDKPKLRSRSDIIIEKYPPKR